MLATVTTAWVMCSCGTLRWYLPTVAARFVQLWLFHETFRGLRVVLAAPRRAVDELPQAGSHVAGRVGGGNIAGVAGDHASPARCFGCG